MKKRTKIVGLVAIVLLAAGYGMEIMHLQGAGITWGLGVLVTVFGFALFLTIDRFSIENSATAKIISIIGYLGASSFILGLGFKFMHWPIATNAMVIGGLVLLIHFLLSNSYISKQSKVEL